jgi:hypothetical protein
MIKTVMVMMVLGMVSVSGETIVGDGTVTNRVEIGDGQAVILRTWAGGKLRLEYDGQTQAVTGTAAGATLVYAGPGTLSFTGMHMVTFDRTLAQGAVTRLLSTNDWFALSVKEGQRLTWLNGGPAHIAYIKDGKYLQSTGGTNDTFHAGQVFDGPLEVQVTSSWRIHVTYSVTDVKQIKVETSSDGVTWEKYGTLPVGSEEKKFYRLAP